MCAELNVPTESHPTPQNMIGHTKHVDKALAAGVDIICAQGSEGGGHTGEVGTSVLLPAVVDKCKGKLSPLTGEQVLVVGAGGVYDGRGLASALAYGCSGTLLSHLKYPLECKLVVMKFIQTVLFYLFGLENVH